MGGVGGESFSSQIFRIARIRSMLSSGSGEKVVAPWRT